MSFTIIDCHTHVYPDKIALRAVESIGSFYGISMHLDGTVGTLLQASQEAGVEKCLVHSAAVDGLHVHHINDFLIRTVEENKDRLIGFGTLHPDMEAPEKELKRILDAGLKGVKLHPDMQKFALNEQRAQKLYDICQGVCPMMFHTGDKRYHYSNPSLVPDVLKRRPELNVICAHFGGYSEWDSAARCLADLPNAYVDTSSSFFAMDQEKARQLISLYGEDRVLFGSDYPMWNVNEEKETLLSLGLSETALQKIFSGNLLKLLK